jgi:hypothetical protein
VFLRSITNRHADFLKVTEDALVYTAEAMKLDLAPEKRTLLLNAYLKLKPWPDAVDALRKLKAWVNRFNLPTEKLGIEADKTSNNLEGLLKFVMDGP